ncbi:hypothetical protein KAR91_79980 [Candidatus Pacearchaeota archaeon]|nr:hypothetical protein [Candidatus Pacearchaeota archaeon]
MPDIVTRLDNTQLKRDLDETENEVKRANLAMAAAIRQTAQLGMLVLQVSGVVIDQIFRLYIESLLIGIELAFAVSAGTFGITQAFQIGQIIAMMVLIRQIKQKKTDAARQTEGAVQLLRMASFR